MKAWDAPSSPPKAKKPSTKAWVPLPPPPRKRKTPKKKEKPPAQMLTYHMTEELDKSVRKHVRVHFAPKKPPPKQTFSAEEKKYFKTLLQPKYGEPLSDYCWHSLA